LKNSIKIVCRDWDRKRKNRREKSTSQEGVNIPIKCFTVEEMQQQKHVSKHKCALRELYSRVKSIKGKNFRKKRAEKVGKR